MGVIELNDMVFFANHGCFEEEQIVGNRFIVSLKVVTDLTIPSLSDELEDTINYQMLYDIVAREMKVTSRLLENVAGRILASVKIAFPTIISCSLTIRKMNPPLGGEVGSSAVTLEL